MLWSLIDTIAASYGWAAVDSVTLAEAIKLVPQITKRKVADALKQLQIFHAEKPQEMAEELQKLVPQTQEEEETIDRAGLANLKRLLMRESKTIKIKE